MKVSRAPEYRSGSGSPLLLILVLLAVVVVGGVVVYILLGGMNSNASEPAPPPTPVTLPSAPIQRPIVPVATLPPPPANTDPVPETPMVEAFQPPEVLYGEVLADGFVDLELLTGRVRTFYSFQVDTSTQNIVLFFGLYEPTGHNISRSVVVEDYSQSELIDNAEITVYYPDAPATVIKFDRPTGTAVSSQFYSTQPHLPEILSPQMRIALIKQNLPLQSGDGSVISDMQLDPTGVSHLSGYRVTVQDQVTTDTALAEIQSIIDQLESRRPRS